jgi:hypothetical protein
MGEAAQASSIFVCAKAEPRAQRPGPVRMSQTVWVYALCGVLTLPDRCAGGSAFVDLLMVTSSPPDPVAALTVLLKISQ